MPIVNFEQLEKNKEYHDQFNEYITVTGYGTNNNYKFYWLKALLTTIFEIIFTYTTLSTQNFMESFMFFVVVLILLIFNYGPIVNVRKTTEILRHTRLAYVIVIFSFLGTFIAIWNTAKVITVTAAGFPLDSSEMMTQGEQIICGRRVYAMQYGTNIC